MQDTLLPNHEEYVRIIKYLQRLGINQIYKVLKEDYVGDFDGKDIYLKRSYCIEEKIFALLHVSGHIVQIHQKKYGWFKEIVKAERDLINNLLIDKTYAKKFINMEKEASQYGLGILRELHLEHLESRFLDMDEKNLSWLIRIFDNLQQHRNINSKPIDYPLDRPHELNPKKVINEEMSGGYGAIL